MSWRKAKRRGATVRKLAAVASMAVLVSAFAWPGCDKSQKPKAESSKTPVIVVSGDTGPWIVPCGCAANQAGGLPRRATYLDELRPGADLAYVDVGGAAAGTTAYFTEKFHAVLRGEVAMGIAAHNLGKAEIALGPAAIAAAATATGAPFISANAKAADGKPLAPAMKVVAIGGKRVAFVGVVSPKFATPAVRVEEPRSAVAAAIGPAKGSYDTLIVLAYLPDEELNALAAALPEADAVIGGPTGQAMPPKHVGPTLAASATNKGKFLVKLAPDQNRWQGEIVQVAHTLADHPGQVSNLKSYLDKLAALDIKAGESGLVQPIAGAPASYQVAGGDSCITCHAGDHDTWVHSKHSHAGDTLKRKGGFHVDPYCLQCHTTGFGLPGGFDSPGRTPALMAVGCESCHGPSAAHAKEPAVRTSFAAFDQCIRCHDQENSPTFERESFWKKIQHGKKEGAK